MTNHSMRMIAGLIVVAIIGALQALNGVAGASAYVTLAIPILLSIEHLLKGNTDGMS